MFYFLYLGFGQLLVLDMSLTVRFIVSCYCSCIVCVMISEINDGDDDNTTSLAVKCKEILEPSAES